MSTLLIIAGFEPNGWAGLLKDIEMAHAVGLKTQCVPTCLTVQPTDTSLTIEASSPTVMQAQLDSLDCTPAVVKIGLLVHRAQAKIIAQWLSQQQPTPTVIVDPVLTSSSNHQTFTKHTVKDLLQPLWPWIHLITPNLPELQQLTGLTELAEDAHVQHLYQQHTKFTGQVLLSGGHSGKKTTGTVTDRLYNATGLQTYWQQTRFDFNQRGTGCLLSTAIACALLKGYALEDAITLGNAKVHADYSADKLTFGWPATRQAYAYVSHTTTSPANVDDIPFTPLTIKSGLYPIVDSSAWVKRLAGTGVQTIQLRIKNQPEHALRTEIKKANDIARQFNLQLFINDHWQLALEYETFGVHLGQEDLQLADLAAIKKQGLRLGISTHGDVELLQALQHQPSYVAVGAIFLTSTKDMSGKIQGLARLRRYVHMTGDTPVVAIGGITNQNCPSVVETGANLIAVVSAISEADDPDTAFRELDSIVKHSAPLTADRM